MPAPDRNPALDEAGTHVITPHLRFDNQSGVLLQLWHPVDWDANKPEWRAIPGFGSDNEIQNPPA